MSALPYKIAVLCYLFDAEGRTLLLHRAKPPNFELFSPIGGKLEQDVGESPTACAVREIKEEVGLDVSPDDLHLTGIVSERAYEGNGHWLLFCYEVLGPVELASMDCPEGTLEWHELDHVMNLRIPESDREVIWPAFLKHRGGFFMVHLDCSDKQLSWHYEQSMPPDGREAETLHVRESGLSP
jgi:8-oxo-dGTP diphosphatase